MQNMGEGDCPFEFNFDAKTFKVGDTVSYRVPSLADFPFVATIAAVYDDHVDLTDPANPGRVFQGTREDRPVVSDEQALG
ncbi:MAG: hypothetical protein K0U79_07685 [Gammaproteobacteria bacterium]|jgi:hypothetical protein|nr:hypothetical protein [Gammaproteobacteria bacterium]